VIETHTVYKIRRMSFYSLLSKKYDHLDPELADNSSTTVGSFSDDQNQAILVHPCSSLSKLICSGTFFFSPTLDLTRSTQLRTANPSKSIFDIADTQFMWNSFMLGSFLSLRLEMLPSEREVIDSSGILVSAIQGFVGITKFRHGIMSIISRLSSLRAGTTFFVTSYFLFTYGDLIFVW
jgi:synaptojanin